jgi:hypothetical protein
MFRQKLTPLELYLNDNTLPLWTSGIMYWVKQSELIFGSDRKSPTSHCPFHGVKKHSSRVVVLPLTSNQKSSFYHLAPGTIQWIKVPEKDSYLSFKYESITAHSVQKKAGVIPHAECIKIIDWLKTRI